MLNSLTKNRFSVKYVLDISFKMAFTCNLIKF